MSGLEIVTGPTIEPISRIEAREHLRLDDDVDDSQIRSYIMAARQWAENYTGRAFITRTVRQYLDATPVRNDPYVAGHYTGHQAAAHSTSIELAAVPAISVTSIKSYDDGGTATTWADSNYYVDVVSDIGRVHLRDGGTWPSDLRAANGLEVNYTAGYGSSPSNVPEPIRLAILQYMTFLYEHRGDFERFPPPTPPAVLGTLLQPYKVLRFGGNPYQKVYRTGIS